MAFSPLEVNCHEHSQDVAEHYSICIANPTKWSSKHASLISSRLRTENYGHNEDTNTVYASYIAGPWNGISPSAQALHFREMQSSPTDFVEFMLMRSLRPRFLDLHGCHNQECLVRVVGAHCNPQGQCRGSVRELWRRQRDPLQQEVVSMPDSQHFKIPLRGNFPVNWLRLEFDARRTKEVHELWLTVLVGVPISSPKSLHESRAPLSWPRPPLSPFLLATAGFQQALRLDFSVSSDSRHCSVCALIELNPHDCEETRREEKSTKAKDSVYSGLPLDNLPPEILLRIMQKLDLPDLARVAPCSRRLCVVANEAMSRPASGELSLRPFWDRITDSVLEQRFVNNRLLRITRLDLSWCGTLGLASKAGVKELLMRCGYNLRSLRMASCEMVDANLLLMIMNTCPKLTEIDLSNCQNVDPEGFVYLLPFARNLELLFLANTRIVEDLAIDIARMADKLKHVDFSSCSVQPDELCRALGSSATHLETLQLRFLRHVTSEGLKHLASGCKRLTELDVTHSFSDPYAAELAPMFAEWPAMRKLFFGGARFLSAESVNGMRACSKLEQLDISGAVYPCDWVECPVTKILEKCTQMRFANISFITAYRLEDTRKLRNAHPNVHIQLDRDDALRRLSPAHHYAAVNSYFDVMELSQRRLMHLMRNNVEDYQVEPPVNFRRWVRIMCPNLRANEVDRLERLYQALHKDLDEDEDDDEDEEWYADDENDDEEEEALLEPVAVF